MSDDKPEREPIAEDARIDALEKRLKAAQEREEDRTEPQVQGADTNYRAGNRVLADLLGGIFGGLVIGWAVDALFDTTPWGLLVGLFLGIVVAFRNVFRMANTQSGKASKED